MVEKRSRKAKGMTAGYQILTVGFQTKMPVRRCAGIPGGDFAMPLRRHYA
jgi:hypothetical protein